MFYYLVLSNRRKQKREDDPVLTGDILSKLKSKGMGDLLFIILRYFNVMFRSVISLHSEGPIDRPHILKIG